MAVRSCSRHTHITGAHVPPTLKGFLLDRRRNAFEAPNRRSQPTSVGVRSTSRHDAVGDGGWGFRRIWAEKNQVEVAEGGEGGFLCGRRFSKYLQMVSSRQFLTRDWLKSILRLTFVLSKIIQSELRSKMDKHKEGKKKVNTFWFLEQTGLKSSARLTQRTPMGFQIEF